jgi:hypothetical protein
MNVLSSVEGGARRVGLRLVEILLFALTLQLYLGGNFRNAAALRQK